MLLELFFYLTIISLISFVGALVVSVRMRHIEAWLEAMVAFAIGALLGDVFIHLMPQLSESGFTPYISATILFGIIVFFLMEKVIHWHHCHHVHHRHAYSRFTYTSLAADALHNMIDGVILAGAFLSGNIIGVSTAIAIIFHEIPQEIGDFSVLLMGGLSKKRALAFNFLISLTAFAGAIATLLFSSMIGGLTPYLIAFAAGSFLYLAGTDLFPELHKKYSTKKAVVQLIFLVLGMVIMASLLLLE